LGTQSQWNFRTNFRHKFIEMFRIKLRQGWTIIDAWGAERQFRRGRWTESLTYLLTELSPSWEAASFATTQELPKNWGRGGQLFMPGALGSCFAVAAERRALLTYLRSWVLLEKLTVLQPLKNFPKIEAGVDNYLCLGLWEAVSRWPLNGEPYLLTYLHTYLLTYLLTELSPSWEAVSFATTQELPSIL
jgi:hypothetical protein